MVSWLITTTFVGNVKYTRRNKYQHVTNSSNIARSGSWSYGEEVVPAAVRRGQSILLILHASGVGAHRLAPERTCRHVKSTLTFTTPYPRGSFARSGGCLQQCSRSIHAPVTSLVLVCGVPVVISTLQGQHAQSSRAPPRPAARTPRSKMEQCQCASSVGEDIEDTPKPEFEGYCQNMSSVQYWGQKTIIVR